LCFVEQLVVGAKCCVGACL